MWWYKGGEEGKKKKKKEKETIRFEVTTSDDTILYGAHERLERFDWNSVETRVETRLRERINERIIEYSGGQMNRTDPSVNIQNVPWLR